MVLVLGATTMLRIRPRGSGVVGSKWIGSEGRFGVRLGGNRKLEAQCWPRRSGYVGMTASRLVFRFGSREFAVERVRLFP